MGKSAHQDKWKKRAGEVTGGVRWWHSSLPDLFGWLSNLLVLNGGGVLEVEN